jgi:hypothetical protein
MFLRGSSCNSLRIRRGKGKPRSVWTIGVWVVNTSEEALPQPAQRRIARSPMSSPFPGQDGTGQAGLAPTSGVRCVPQILLRLPPVRQRSSVLRRALSADSSSTQVPRVQPCLPATVQRPQSSRGETSPLSFWSTKTSSESDGSPSCIASSFWQSRPQKTKASRTASPLLAVRAVGRRRVASRQSERSMSEQFAGNAKPHPAPRAPGMDVRAGDFDVTDIPWGVAP